MEGAVPTYKLSVFDHIPPITFGSESSFISRQPDIPIASLD